jgi:hypothetical protein
MACSLVREERKDEMGRRACPKFLRQSFQEPPAPVFRSLKKDEGAWLRVMGCPRKVP